MVTVAFEQMLRRHLTIWTIFVLGLPAAETAETVQKTVNRYCFGCHNNQLKSGEVSLAGLKPTGEGPAAETWEKVLRKVKTAEMPPPGAPKPTAEVRTSVAAWLEEELDRAGMKAPNPGAPVMHRLNRAEYTNAVRDLLGLDLDHGATLPVDDSGYGFDNIGEVLTVSPLLLEKYLATARRVARLALGTVKAQPVLEKYVPNRGADALSPDELPLSVRTGMAFRRYFPLDGEYVFTVRMRGSPDVTLPQAKLDLRIDGVRAKLFDVAISDQEEQQYTRNYELRLPMKAGMHTIAAGVLAEGVHTEAGVAPRARGFAPPPNPTPVSVDYVTVGGPYNAVGASETESRKRIFVCRPAAGVAEEPCARRIVTTLARRAYRRPVTATDVEPLVAMFRQGRKDGGSFDAGVETALRALLVSPSFLFRVERAPKGIAPGAVYAVSDLELASRLSFFLWSSLPDDELVNLAAAGKLRAALPQQVKRMLLDPKSKALVDNFAGQWLHLRNISGWKPDPDKYAQFDEDLRRAMQQETELFFDYVIREDRSVLEFINADYTFVNERLARHYGLKGVRGGYFRRVNVDANERGGILSQGSILTVTSYPTRTSPVLRGKWILENVLGSPPPPPPADVPDLEDAASHSAKDLRAALEKHRANASCASCHARLDPMGFALENYDAVGLFRKSEGGAEIDASGAMPNGTLVNGPGSLKKILMERRDEFLDCLSEKLLTYALGRGVESQDLPTVRQVRRDTIAGDYRFSSLVLAIVNSVPFQMRRNP